MYKLLTMASSGQLSVMFDGLPPGHPAKAPFAIFQQASDSVRGGIIIGLASRIQVFQNRMICEITKHRDLDLTLPGRQQCAYVSVK
jgi:type IV secretion system protein VirD4